MKSKLSRDIIIALICALAGLGPAVAPGQSPAPCSLLTPAEISAVVGATAGAGQPIATTGCSWSAPHRITTVSLSDAAGWQKMKTPLPGIAKTPIIGLGDDAFLSMVGPPGKEFASLSVMKGGTVYVIRVYGGNPTDQASMEKTLAADVLAKL
jgi:hypothetical protein